VHLDALHPEHVHGGRRLAAPVLAGGDDPGVRGLASAALHGAPALEVEVLEQEVAVACRVLQREQEGALLHVHVVARAPLDRRERRVRPVPLAARLRRAQLDLLVLRPVGLRLVEAADAVAQVRDEEQVVRRPAVVEAARPDAGDAALGHLADLVLGEHPPLVGDHRVEVHVVGPGPGRDVEVGDRLVEVVQHGRLPVEEGPQHVLGQREADPETVAVVVVRDVLAPPRQRQGLPRLLLEVEIVDHPLAPVHLEHRRQGDDHLVADVADERRLLDGQAVGQLHQHLGAAGLRGVEVASRPVDGLAGRDELPRLRLGERPGIGEVVEDLPVALEAGDGRLVGDEDHDHVAAFLALADAQQLHARRRLLERLHVAEDVLVVRQLVRCTRDPAEELQRRRHRCRRRQVIDQLGDDPRVLGVLLDLRGVLGVDLLRRGPGPLAERGSREDQGEGNRGGGGRAVEPR